MRRFVKKLYKESMIKTILLSLLIISILFISGCTVKTTVSSSSSINPNTMYAPNGLATDTKGCIYAVSREKSNVQKFDSSGNLVTIWKLKGDEGYTPGPDSISVDINGRIFVSDSSAQSIWSLDASGRSIANWYPEDSSVSSPKVAADQKGGVFVLLDAVDCSIQRYDSSGKFLSKLQSQDTRISDLMSEAFTTDNKGNIYIAESSGTHTSEINGKTVTRKTVDRILKFDQSGKLIASWVDGVTGDIRLHGTSAIAVDDKDNIYILDMTSVRKYNSSGKLIIELDDIGHGPGEFTFEESITVDHNGNLYVGDSNNGRIQKFDLSGKFIRQWNMK